MPQMHSHVHFSDGLGVSAQQEERPASPDIEHSTRQSAAPLARLGLEALKGYKRDQEAKDDKGCSRSVGNLPNKATSPGNEIRLKLRSEIRISFHAGQF